MSNAPDSDPSHDLPHEGPIKTPKQLIVTVAASFIVPIVVIVMLVNYVDIGNKTGAGGTGLSPEAVALRIQPVRTATGAEASRSAMRPTG